MRCLVKDGNPADAIAEAIAEYHPCILVAGVKRASGTPGPHGTAFALLSASRVPVLCVPPEGRTPATSGRLRFPWNPVTGGNASRGPIRSRKGQWAGERRNRTVLSDRINCKSAMSGVGAWAA